MPNSRPPQLLVSERGEQGIAISYASPRRLCAFLSGLVEGTARHYGEQALIEERTCMERGDPICDFEVRFQRTPIRAETVATGPR
jgi:hypothetical protein